MNAVSADLGGVYAVPYALWEASERLDRAAMRRQVEMCLAAGVAGSMVLGLAPEVAKLSGEACLLGLDALMVTSETLGANLRGAAAFDHAVIRPRPDAVTPQGGITVLCRKLAPAGVVLKPFSCWSRTAA